MKYLCHVWCVKLKKNQLAVTCLPQRKIQLQPFFRRTTNLQSKFMLLNYLLFCLKNRRILNCTKVFVSYLYKGIQLDFNSNNKNNFRNAFWLPTVNFGVNIKIWWLQRLLKNESYDTLKLTVFLVIFEVTVTKIAILIFFVNCFK